MIPEPALTKVNDAEITAIYKTWCTENGFKPSSGKALTLFFKTTVRAIQTPRKEESQ